MTPRLKIAKTSARRPGSFASIDDAVEAIRAGQMVIVVDDEDRENEGDLTIAAEKVTPQAINFMARYGRGLICMPMTAERLDELEVPLMVSQNTARFSTAFCVSVEAKATTSTGISAGDRAATVLAAIDPRTGPQDLARPGHMFPLRARAGGVLVRAGQTEAAVDLARIAGLYPAGVICEIMNDDGTMARVPELRNLRNVTSCRSSRSPISSSTGCGRSGSSAVSHPPCCPRIPAPSRSTRSRASSTGRLTLRWSKGEIGDGYDLMVRVHSRCLTGDVFHSARCDCGAQLEAAMARIEQEGRGVLLYLNQEGRGIGLSNKIRAYELQDQGYDTVEANERLGFKADQRDYGIGAQILGDLGVKTMRLLTNNPRKFIGLEGYGLSVVESLALEIPPSESTRRYLLTKKHKLGHKLSSV